MIIYVDEVTERLVYTLDFVFKDRKVEYQLTNDLLYFTNCEGVKFNYSKKQLQDTFSILPSKILFEEEITEIEVGQTIYLQEEMYELDGVIDPLAAIFYAVSRYEEYLPSKKDEHDRFEPESSTLFTFGWLKKCVADRWAEALISAIQLHYGVCFKVAQIPVQYVPTFDIDISRAFEWKEGIRTIYGKWKDWAGKDKISKQIRNAVLSGKQKDPYDTFDKIEAYADLGYEVKMFWLVGDLAKYDRNISAFDQRHRILIRKMSQLTDLGIHPSYKSNSSTYYLENEIERLNEIVGYKVSISRQHYLKCKLPETYRHLLEYGIREDFTMGYAAEVGFRAGTARAFYFFDLLKNMRTSLKIRPFAYMDGTLHEYLNCTIVEAKFIVDELIKEVKTYGGDFISIWHNESIADYGKWKGWSVLIDQTMDAFKIEAVNEDDN
jgi:hypothetical protein